MTFVVFETSLKMIHDEPGGSPRFVVNQIDLAHDDFTSRYGQPRNNGNSRNRHGREYWQVTGGGQVDT